jgi:hypothetical protein
MDSKKKRKKGGKENNFFEGNILLDLTKIIFFFSFPP